MRIPAFVVLILCFEFSAAFAKASPCAEKTKQGEDQIDANNYTKAVTVLEEAVTACGKDKNETSARPYVALGKAYFELQRYREAIKQFEFALTKEANLPLAFMDLGASYMQLGDFEKSVEWSRKALNVSDKRMAMKVNYNIGLALFKAAAAKNDESDHSSEPYFAKSKELDPSFGGNYFYLGVLKEVSYKDAAAAKALYQQGCDRKYPQACQYLQTIDQRMGGAQAAAPVSAGPKKELSAENKQLLKDIQAGYARKGMETKDTAPVIANLENACSQMAQDQCKTMLSNVVNSLK